MNKEDVARFLTICKIAAKFNLILELTDKNKQTIASLGYQLDDVKNTILGLSVEDYAEGPLIDRKGYAGDFWVFGTIIEDKEIYIKLKVKNINSTGDKQLSTLCISFHFAEHAIIYPFK